MNLRSIKRKMDLESNQKAVEFTKIVLVSINAMRIPKGVKRNNNVQVRAFRKVMNRRKGGSK